MNEQKTKKAKSYSRQIPERRVSFSRPSKYSKSPSSLPLKQSSKHGATSKHYSMSRDIVTSNSRPSKSSLKLGKSQNKTIGVRFVVHSLPPAMNFKQSLCGDSHLSESSAEFSTRPRRRDSSTTVNSHLLSPYDPTRKHGSFRRSKRDHTSSLTVGSQNDPTPIHLKYGTFRRLSKLRTSRDADMPSPNSRPDSRPVLVACSSVSKNTLLPSSPRQSVGKSGTGSPVDKARPVRPSLPAVDRSPTPPPKLGYRDVYLNRTDTMHIDIKPKKFTSILWC